MAIIEFHCELWHVSSLDEVTAEVEVEPECVIYNIEEYNRTYIVVLTINGCCLFEVFGQLMDFLLKTWKTFVIAMC